MEWTVRRLPVTHHRGKLWDQTCLSTGASARCQVTRRARPAPLARESSRLNRPRSVYCRAKGARAGEQELADNPSEYFEPFLRSLLLGVGAGIVCEALHVAVEFHALVREVRLDQLAQAWPSVQGQFAPVVVDDHLVAIACWLLFYGIEAYAVMKVLEKHNKNPAAAARALRTLTTFPRILLPRLTLFKSALRMPAVIWQWTAAWAYVGAAASPGQHEKLGKGRVAQQRPVAAPPLSDPDQEPEGPVDGPQVPPLRGLLIPQQLGGKGRTAERPEEVTRRPGEVNFPMPAIERRREQLRDAKCFLKNFWYAAGFSRDLKDAPMAVDMLGETVVLYRNSHGGVVCLSNYCPHKGAPLSDGTICDIDGHDCIVCPYHGWAFDAEGRLRTLPSDEAGGYERSSKPQVTGYPVVEKGGFIWLFFGSTDLPADERPPVPYVPELDDPEWRAVYGDIAFECNHSAVFENAIDMAHIHYLHADSFGNQDMPQIREMACDTNAYGVDATFVLHNKPANPMWSFSEVPEVSVTAKALLPSTSVIAFTLAQGLSFITFVSTVPISATETINRFALIRRLGSNPILSAIFNWGVWDFLAVKAMLKILSQDKVMVEKLRPEMLLREVSAKADLPQIAFRKLRQQYIDMGYGVRATSVLGADGDSRRRGNQ